MTRREWWKLSRFERYCWIWDFKNRFIGQFENSKYPYLRIRFEDFLAIHPDPLHALNRLFTFLNFETAAEFKIENLF